MVKGKVGFKDSLYFQKKKKQTFKRKVSWEIDLVISIYFKRILRDGIGREVGSGWETHVHMWWVHVNVWKNQYNTVK